MGTYMYTISGGIKLTHENMKKAIEKLYNKIQEENLELGWSCLDWTPESDYEYIWDDLGYSLQKDDTYYIIDSFIQEKYGDDDTLFDIIAEFCEDGYMEMGTNEGRFRFTFKDGKFKEIYPKLLWENELPTIECHWVTCIHNTGTKIAGTGICTNKEKIELSDDDLSCEECGNYVDLLNCKAYEYDHNKKLEK